MLRALLVLAMLFPSSVSADERKPELVTVDLSKLPPGIAKKVRKAAVESPRLPPGLAKKPADHPGRVAWLKNHAK